MAGVHALKYFGVRYQTALSVEIDKIDVESYLISWELFNDTSQGQDVLYATFFVFESGLLLSQPLSKGEV